MLGPSRRHFVQELGFRKVRQLVHGIQQVRAQLVGYTIIEERSVLVQDKVVSVAVELFKGQLRRIAIVDFVNGIGQNVPNLLGGRSVHGNVRPEGLLLMLLLLVVVYVMFREAKSRSSWWVGSGKRKREVRQQKKITESNRINRCRVLVGCEWNLVVLAANKHKEGT